MNVFNWLKRQLYPHKYCTQTFTYFVPAPPKRNTGYREKEFDKVFYNFINSGYELINLTTQNSGVESSPGMWIIATVRATKPNLKLNLSEDYTQTTEEDEQIDDLYYIHEK